MSYRFGNSGYSLLGDTDAVILQKASDLSSSITGNLLQPVAILVKRIVSSVQPLSTFVCFQEIKFLADKQTLFTFAVTIKSVAVQYTTFD